MLEALPFSSSVCRSRFTLLKSGSVFAQSSLSAASLLICASGFHGELSLGCAELKIKVLPQEAKKEAGPEAQPAPPAVPPAEPLKSASLKMPRGAERFEKPYRVKPFAVTKAARARSWTPRRLESFVELEIKEAFAVEISKEHLPKHLQSI